MTIPFSQITRVILLVSPGRASYEDSVTFKSLSQIAENKRTDQEYYYWLIHTEQSKATAEFIDVTFNSQFSSTVLNRLYPVSSFDNAHEIFDLVIEIASLPINQNHEVYCDCTGGTKTMSIAMALASHHHSINNSLNMASTSDLKLIFVPPTEKKEITFDEFDLSRIKAEELKERIYQQQQLAQMQYLARFSAILAHEIKGSLNRINAAQYLLQRKIENHSDRNRLLGHIESTVFQMTRIIDEVQQVVRGESRELFIPEISLDDVMHRIQERTRSRFPELKFEITGEWRNIKVKIFEEKLYIIFTNLIDNAAYATEGTGMVKFHLQTQADKLLGTIEDNGPGIPVDMRPYLFKPMQRGKNSSGTGMGLNIVETFVLDEGGTIHYDDSFQQGTRFLIELPLHQR